MYTKNSDKEFGVKLLGASNNLFIFFGVMTSTFLDPNIDASPALMRLQKIRWLLNCFIMWILLFLRRALSYKNSTIKRRPFLNAEIYGRPQNVCLNMSDNMRVVVVCGQNDYNYKRREKTEKLLKMRVWIQNNRHFRRRKQYAE